MKASGEIIIATGGTGGHIFPALSCGDYFEKNGRRVRYLLAGSKIGSIERENVIYFSSQHFALNPLKFAKALYYLIWNFFRSIQLLLRERPCAILATGSYAVVPVIVAGVLLRIPLFLMEQNVIPGMVNRFFSRFAISTFVAFSETTEYLHGKGIHTGLPLRTEALQWLPKEESRKILGLPAERTIILVIGGSLGARGMVEKIIPQVKRNRELLFLIQTGNKNFEYFTSQLGSPKVENCILFPFIKEIGLYYSASDIVISRAGASSCMEIAFHKVPAILVPYPYSRDKHQYYNAAVLEKYGLSVVIDETELSQRLESYLTDFTWIKRGQKDFNVYLHEPASIILEEIEKYADCKKV